LVVTLPDLETHRILPPLVTNRRARYRAKVNFALRSTDPRRVRSLVAGNVVAFRHRAPRHARVRFVYLPSPTYGLTLR
jgi:hypothetical protein